MAINPKLDTIVGPLASSSLAAHACFALIDSENEGNSRTFDETFGHKSFLICNDGGESYDYASSVDVSGGIFFGDDDENDSNKSTKFLEATLNNMLATDRIFGFFTYDDDISIQASKPKIEYFEPPMTQESVRNFSVIGSGTESWVDTGTSCMLRPDKVSEVIALQASPEAVPRYDISNSADVAKLSRMEVKDGYIDTGESCLAPNTAQGQAALEGLEAMKATPEKVRPLAFKPIDDAAPATALGQLLTPAEQDTAFQRFMVKSANPGLALGLASGGGMMTGQAAPALPELDFMVAEAKPAMPKPAPALMAAAAPAL